MGCFFFIEILRYQCYSSEVYKYVVVNMDINDWRCPACNTNVNSSGGILCSSWAVACHMAGKIRTGDHTHRRWAKTNIGEHTCEYYDSLNDLANDLEQKMIEENNIRMKAEQERIQRLVEKMDEEEEPDISSYRYIKRLENELHAFVSRVLQKAYGEDERDWWCKGVPLKIRSNCAVRREQDQARDQIHKFTDFSDLKTIIGHNRSLFKPNFAYINDYIDSPKDFYDNLEKSNMIRRKVMHTIREPVILEDARFLGEFCEVVTAFIGSQSSEI